ncbi:helix-turn-helix domain-containing protein [Anaerovorax odorimutans]|uniref:helix-turn-helix domain-containing protein n=1 Tax=Anaerovorax odorimutans TaxID=109327 RepID=UPI000412E689|nr:helix-turn-helix transcriptional regulator [Anaerovorax odorimutans]
MKYQTEGELYAAIGKNIKYYREKSNITQTKLCELSGISISYLTKIEAPNCNKSISLALLNDIANALNIEITSLLERRN